MDKSVTVLNQAFLPLGKVSIEKAMCLIYVGKAYAVSNTNQVVRTMHLAFPIPEIICMPAVQYVRRPAPEKATKKGIFTRDNHKCVYCGSSGRLTLDHVVPRVRWSILSEQMGLTYGLNDWYNLVTACADCNSYKDDRLLSEIGWPEVKPTAPLQSLEIDWSLIMQEQD